MSWTANYELEKSERAREVQLRAERQARIEQITARRLARAAQIADRVTEEMQSHRERVRGCPLHIRTAFELLGIERLIREWRRAGLL